LRRWTGIADRTRAARLEHSLHRQDGGKGTITNHREANAKGKPNMADTAAPNKLEPRIDSGTCRPAPGIARTARPPFHIFGIMSKFMRKCRSVGFQGPSQRTGREYVSFRSARQPEVDAPRVACLERSKLLSHDERRMVEQHDSTRPARIVRVPSAI